MSNVAKYTEEEGHVAVYMEPEQGDIDGVKLRISNSGAPIPKQELPRVMERGYVGSNGRKQTRGSGLGLYMARTLSEKLGHDIEVMSTASETVVELHFGTRENMLDVTTL